MNNNLREKYIKALVQFQKDKYPFSINELVNIDWIKTEGDNISCMKNMINSSKPINPLISKKFDFIIKYDDAFENKGMYHNVFIVSVFLKSTKDESVSLETFTKIHQRNPLNHNCWVIEDIELRKLCYNKSFLKENYVTRIKV